MNRRVDMDELQRLLTLPGAAALWVPVVHFYLWIEKSDLINEIDGMRAGARSHTVADLRDGPGDVLYIKDFRYTRTTTGARNG